jgi:selenium metabolism protein YedF
MGKTFWFTSETVGRGDDELGRILMRNLIYTLARGEELPEAVMFMNGGVRLACAGSQVLDDLKLMEEQGVVVRVCGTCLDFLGLKEKLAVGEIGDMKASAARLAVGPAVVTVT